MRSRFVAFALLATLVVAFALPATAAESTTEQETTTTEVVSDYQPAVQVDLNQAEAPASEPWTTRFLVPTGLVLAALALFGTVVQYFMKVVRSRYKVVE